MAYEVRLEVFEGPIDLLLHLITRQRVDIYEVSLATITDEYLHAVEAMDGLDLDAATGFLVVAATLLELKSARLLPARGFDDADARLLEERDLLLARLVECSTFRDAGAWLHALLLEGEAWHGRSAAMEARYLDLLPELVIATSPEDLARIAAQCLAPREEVALDMSHVAPIRASVRDAIAELAGMLQRDGATTFEALCGRRTERIEVVVRFLALLELYKAGAVELDQTGRFGTIRATWTGEAETTDVLVDAEEYTFEA